MQTALQSLKRLTLLSLFTLPLLGACGGGGDAGEQPAAKLPPACPPPSASSPCA